MKGRLSSLVWGNVPRRVVTVLVGFAIFAVPCILWGRTVFTPNSQGETMPGRELFTMSSPPEYVTFDSITDNPRVGAEPNFLRVSRGNNEGYSDTMTMQEGGTYYVRLYVHNNARDDLHLFSTNTRVHINLPLGEGIWGKKYEVNGFIWSDNARPNEIWDNIVLRSDREFHVKVISAKYYNNIRTEATNGFDLGSDLFDTQDSRTAASSFVTPLMQKGLGMVGWVWGPGPGANPVSSKDKYVYGARIGYEQMDGDVPSGLAYSGYVLVKFQPIFK